MENTKEHIHKLGLGFDPTSAGCSSVVGLSWGALKCRINESSVFSVFSSLPVPHVVYIQHQCRGKIRFLWESAKILSCLFSCAQLSFSDCKTQNSPVVKGLDRYMVSLRSISIIEPRGRGRKEENVLFNDALNTFYLWLYGVRHMVKDHSDSERGNPLLPHGLLFPINSKGSFICIIPQTGGHIPQPLLCQ